MFNSGGKYQAFVVPDSHLILDSFSLPQWPCQLSNSLKLLWPHGILPWVSASSYPLCVSSNPQLGQTREALTRELGPPGFLRPGSGVHNSARACAGQKGSHFLPSLVEHPSSCSAPGTFSDTNLACKRGGEEVPIGCRQVCTPSAHSSC